VLNTGARRRNQIVSLTEVTAQDADLVWGPERGVQQSERVELLYPLAVQYVGLAPGSILDMSCVDQIDLETAGLKDLVKRDPVDSGGFHGYGIDSASLQPIGQVVQIAGERFELSHWLRIAIRWHGYVMFLAADVNAGSIEVQRRNPAKGLAWIWVLIFAA